MLRTGSQALKEATVDCKAQDKFKVIWNSETEVKNIFMTDSYKTQIKMKKSQS